MFHAGFHTVSVKDEVKHVENYFAMQEIKYPNRVIHFCDIAEGVQDWPIPQMLMHTFIENEYKHAASLDGVLTILIKIRKTEINQCEMLLIEIEDDGNGYPQEILDYVSGSADCIASGGERIGLSSIKGMLELMYDRKNLLEIRNVQPHGCCSRIYIPYTPVHEMTSENEV